MSEFDPAKVIDRELAGQVYAELLGRHTVLADALRAVGAQLADMPPSPAIARLLDLVERTLKADAEAAVNIVRRK